MNAQRQVKPMPDGGQPPDFVSVREARSLLSRTSTPIHRQTVFSLGVDREIDIRRVAGRYLITRESIDAYRTRRGIR